VAKVKRNEAMGGADPTLLLTLPEVAHILRLRTSTMYHAGLRRSLPWITISRQLRMRRSDLDTWLDQQQASQRRRVERMRRAA